MSDSRGLRLLLFVHDLEVSKPDSDVVYVRALCWGFLEKIDKRKVLTTRSGLIIHFKENQYPNDAEWR